jgi:hypothetical protein
LVIGSRTYQVDDFSKRIQMVCLNNVDKFSEKKLSVAEILNVTTDIPSCVSYIVSNGQKMFSVPEKGCEILLTQRGLVDDICSSRLNKYVNRGYEFYKR